ncbi:MAG: helix-turn-helix transcriptional regulator [Clostridia bacterium]|nr:helix-turn-helix transcriptional regulator [Clostridia bacterium]
MKKSTEELLKILKNSSLDAYLAENGGEMAENPICYYLTAVLNEKGLKKSEVIKKSNVQTNYAYQIFSGLKIPSRDKLIALCFGMDVSLDEAQTLLKYTGFAPLYPRNKRDIVIVSALENGESVIRCNITLDELNLSPL